MFTIANACNDLDDKGVFTVSYWSVNIMVRYSIEQRVFLIETYFTKKKSVKKCIRKFRLKFPEAPVPTQPYVNQLIRKLHITGSMLDKKKERKRNVLTEEKLTDIQARLQLSPRKSLRRLSQETDVAYTTARRATKLLGFRPYRILEVHRIKHTHFNLSITFCSWLLRNVHGGIIDPNLFFMSDEAWFHVSGNVNAQKSHIWDTENPHVLHQRPLHDINVGVCCAVSARRVIGPIFFGDTVISDRYVSNILEPFFQELTEEETLYGLLSTR
jgi:hypothetical protein